MSEQGTDPKKITNPYYTYGILYLSENFHRWEKSQGPEYHAYRRAWAERMVHLDPGDFPLNLNMEVTTRCNLACTFCTQPSLTKDQVGDMPWELYARVLEEGERYRTPAANLNGLGEPTLMRDLPRRIRFAKEHGFQDVMFHTNGTIMTEQMARALIEAGLDRAIFSVDSPDKETYESMRIHSNWDRVISHVRTFWKVRQEMGRSSPIIRTTMVVTDRTVHQVPDFVSLWKPMADQITLQDLTWRTKLLDNGAWENQERSAIPTDMTAIREEAAQHKLSFVCPYLYQSSYAFWNGDVIPCSNPNARKHMIMGNLGSQSLKEVWDGKTYTELRQLHAAGKWAEHPICRDCEVPLIELYKTLEKDKASLQPSQAAPPVVASKLGEAQDSNTDLVLKFQSELQAANPEKDDAPGPAA